MLQDVFEKAFTLKAGLQLAKGIHLGRSPQVMQVSIDANEAYNQERFNRCVHQMHIKDNRARLNACWICEGIEPFHKDCTTS